MSHFLDYNGLVRFFTGLKNKFVDQANTLTTAQIQAILESQQSPINVVSAEVSAVLLAAHPVGSYYQSDDPTSPAVLFGGTWESVHGRFLLAEGENEANTDETYGSLTAGALNVTAGDTSGEAGTELTTGNIPRFTGSIYAGGGNTGATGGGYGPFRSGSGVFSTSSVMQYAKPKSANAETWPSGDTYGHAVFSLGEASPAAVNNMPPFVAVYTWHRIA